MEIMQYKFYRYNDINKLRVGLFGIWTTVSLIFRQMARFLVN